MQSNSNPTELIQKIELLLQSIVPFFALCMIGGSLTSRYDDFDLYVECDWLTFPSKLQRVTPIIILNTQDSFVFEIYGEIACNPELFKTVISLR